MNAGIHQSKKYKDQWKTIEIRLKIIKLVNKNPPSLFDIFFAFWIKVSASEEKIDLIAIEYRLNPVRPVKSLITFLRKLAFVIGKGALKLRSGSFSVSVNLWCA